ncbi:alpha-2C adrenergic receptor [Trichonephila clavipes]|uniref:Alpha-2C adrenergic receptor n=1 Tax=Trichonephila clavipes TaxID=2585209 RepID=A0A8X6VWJ3_TRICX|nr:alpha-2C adrenergic receptor [Trichonephila clavipes]
MEVNSTNSTHLLSVEYVYFTETSIDRNGTFSLASKNISWTGIATGEEDWENYNYWNGSQYPSGYSQLRIILTAFFVTFIMVVIVVGNMLVCIAIATEKALKTVQNWFIASLAVSDFLVGLVIMPFSLAKELMGYWIFGTVWCDIHSALDVLLCTASINNLCLISLDRYWSVTQAVEYLKKRTATRAVLMICFVWVLSALISLPPLLGWKKEERPEDYPSCSLSDDVGYVLYSALGSFYVPAFVMVFVYIKIFMAARSRARRHVKKASEVTNDPPKDKSTTTTTCTSFSNTSPPDKRRDPDVFR